MTVVACPYEAPGHRAGMLATLEDRNACRERCFISVDPLHEAPAAGRHVVDELRLMQPKTVEVDHIHVGAQARHQPAAIRQTEKVGGFAGLPLDQMLERQSWPTVRSRPQCASMKLGRPESTIEVQCAPPSLKPSRQAGSLSISRIGSWSPTT